MSRDINETEELAEMLVRYINRKTNLGNKIITRLASINNSKSNSILYQRPIPLGVSGGNKNSVRKSGLQLECCGGTLGCLVSNGSTKYILSNYHVLVNEPATIGDPIIQPGLLDSKCSATDDVIATLAKWEPIKPQVSQSDKIFNYIDAAIAEVIPGKVRADGYIEGIGLVNTQPAEVKLGLKVIKSGRTTGVTYGRIVGIDANVLVTYEKSCGSNETYQALFSNQIIIEPDTEKNPSFSLSGDSGSLVVTEDELLPVGLLFAGNDKHTYANPISHVINTFGVSIVGVSGKATPLPYQAEQIVCQDKNSYDINKAIEVKKAFLPILINYNSFIGSYLTKSDDKYKIVVMVEKDHSKDVAELPSKLCGVDIEITETARVKIL